MNFYEVRAVGVSDFFGIIISVNWGFVDENIHLGLECS